MSRYQGVPYAGWVACVALCGAILSTAVPVRAQDDPQPCRPPDCVPPTPREALESAAPPVRVQDDPEPCREADCDPPDPLVWDPGWTPFRLAEWFVIGGAIGGIIASSVLGPRREIWNSRVRLDESVRDGLRLGTQRGRQVALDTSDVLLSILMSYPMLIDGALVAGWYRDNGAAAIALAFIVGEALALTGLVGTIVKVAATRERPFVRECGGELDPDTLDCTRTSRHYSYFSGHTAQTFAAAAATCMIHRYVPLYGGGLVEGVPCAVGLFLAATTGMLRMLGDVHYLTDVLTGAAVGAGIGLLIPWIHLRGGSPRPWQSRVRVVPYGLGLGIERSL